jgi:hypothetical protein
MFLYVVGVLFCCCWCPAVAVNIPSAPGVTNGVGVPSDVGIPAVTGVPSVFSIHAVVLHSAVDTGGPAPSLIVPNLPPISTTLVVDEICRRYRNSVDKFATSVIGTGGAPDLRICQRVFEKNSN